MGTSLYLKRLEAGKFIWPAGGSGEAVAISAAQLGYLLEGGLVAQISCNWERALPETEFRRYVQNLSSQVRSSG